MDMDMGTDTDMDPDMDIDMTMDMHHEHGHAASFKSVMPLWYKYCTALVLLLTIKVLNPFLGHILLELAVNVINSENGINIYIYIYE
jgi:hypothetical protein